MTCVGADIAKSGLWVNTHLYQHGEHLNANAYLVHNGQARVVKATVDLRPIAKAVAHFMKTLEAKEAVANEAVVQGLDPHDIDYSAVGSFLDTHIEGVDGETMRVVNEVGLGWLGRKFRSVSRGVKKTARSAVRAVKHPIDSLSAPMSTLGKLDPTGLVSKAGKVKLVRQLNNSIDRIARVGVKGAQGTGQFLLDNPAITGSALAAVTAVFPPAAVMTLPAMAALPQASKLNRGIGAASRAARGKANLLDAGLKGVMAASGGNVPVGKMAQQFAKYLPPEAKNLAHGAVSNALQAAVSKAGGKSGLSSLGPKQWGEVFKNSMPPQLKNIALEGLIAKRAVVPKTARLMPRVSDKALGMYAVASKTVQAIERGKGLNSLRRHLGLGTKIPAIMSKLRRDAGMLKLAASRASRLAPAQRAKAMAAIARSEQKLKQRARNVKAMRRMIGGQLMAARRLGPGRIRQVRRDANQAAIVLKQLQAAAHSPNPRVRGPARRAVASFQAVARGRQRVRDISRGRMPGFSVSGDLVGMDLTIGAAPVRLARISEVMPTIGYGHTLEIGADFEVGGCGCGPSCGCAPCMAKHHPGQATVGANPYQSLASAARSQAESAARQATAQAQAAARQAAAQAQQQAQRAALQAQNQAKKAARDVGRRALQQAARAKIEAYKRAQALRSQGAGVQRQAQRAAQGASSAARRAAQGAARQAKRQAMNALKQTPQYQELKNLGRLMQQAQRIPGAQRAAVMRKLQQHRGRLLREARQAAGQARKQAARSVTQQARQSAGQAARSTVPSNLMPQQASFSF